MVHPHTHGDMNLPHYSDMSLKNEGMADAAVIIIVIITVPPTMDGLIVVKVGWQLSALKSPTRKMYLKYKIVTEKFAYCQKLTG